MPTTHAADAFAELFPLDDESYDLLAEAESLEDFRIDQFKAELAAWNAKYHPSTPTDEELDAMYEECKSGLWFRDEIPDDDNLAPDSDLTDGEAAALDVA